MTRRGRLAVACLAALVALGGGTPARVAFAQIEIGDEPLPAPDPPSPGFGAAVAVLGDVTGDGVPDLVVGDPLANRVYIYSGADLTLVRTLADPEDLRRSTCADGSCRFGHAVARVGDVDGDGMDDLAVGAPGPSGLGSLAPPTPVCVSPPCREEAPPDPSAGRGRVLIFSTRTWAPVLRLGSTGPRGFGEALARLADLTGDGQPELAVAASQSSEVFALDLHAGRVVWRRRLRGDETSFIPRLHLVPVGDVTRDGVPDLLVGFPGAKRIDRVRRDEEPSEGGAVELLSGATGAIVWSIRSPHPEGLARFGSAVAGVGDQSGDGREDFAIGEPTSGLVYIVSSDGDILHSFFASPSDCFDQVALARAGGLDATGRPGLWVGCTRPDPLVTLRDPLSGAVLGARAGVPGGSFAATPDLRGSGAGDLLVGCCGEAHLLFAVRPLPDLRAFFLFLFQEPASNCATAKAVVENRGLLDSPPVTVAFTVNGTLIDQRQVPPLKVGAATEASVRWDVSRFKSPQLVRVVVDPQNLVPESDEQNNADEKPLGAVPTPNQGC